MHEYNIRVLKSDGTLSLSMLTVQLNPAMAIRAGQKMAQGQAFEVWRDDQRFYKSTDNVPLLFPDRRPAA